MRSVQYSGPSVKPFFYGSLHLELPVREALEAIVAGWTERHVLAVAGSIPGTIAMVSGPRNEQELEVVWSILLASYRFARNGVTNE